MIRIICHNDNVEERKYVINILFHTLLEMPCDAYEIVFVNPPTSYIIELNNHRVIIEDHFFKRFQTPLSYFHEQNIPTRLKFFHALGREIPIIYGEDIFEKKDGTILIGLDIFASTFFMLTRWEESLMGREENGDCDETMLFTVKNDISKRPIVDEYGALLRSVLQVDNDIHFNKHRVFDVILTHDVDAMLTPTWKQLSRCIIKRGGLFKVTYNKSLTLLNTLRYKFTYSNEYSQFRLYTNLAEQSNICEWFYFKACKTGEKEASYSYLDKRTIRVVSLLKRRKNSKCVLGFHPSQFTLNNPLQWEQELKRIEEMLLQPIEIGRNHHLLYNHDMQLCWESLSGRERDCKISNCTFHNRIGFRSGITGPYQLFDIFQRRPLKVIEYPCQIMDTAIISHKYQSESEAWNDIVRIVDEVRKYKGVLVLTWHILIRDPQLLKQYYNLCENTIKYAFNDIINEN